MNTGLQLQAVTEEKEESDEVIREGLERQLSEINAADIVEVALALVDNSVYVPIGKRRARDIVKEYSKEITVLVMVMQDGMRIAELSRRGFYGKGPVKESKDWKANEAAEQQN